MKLEVGSGPHLGAYLDPFAPYLALAGYVVEMEPFPALPPSPRLCPQEIGVGREMLTGALTMAELESRAEILFVN